MATCDRCGGPIEEGEGHTYANQTLCEECYMDALSPVRTCDPWAVHSAKTLSRQSRGEVAVTPKQEKILDVLRETGGADFSTVAERAGLSPTELEREVAALRHMEKVRGEMREGRKVLCLW